VAFASERSASCECLELALRAREPTANYELPLFDSTETRSG
jgi:hypothetical protein